MTEIYVIVTKTFYINKQTTEFVGHYKSTETIVEDGFDIPIVFSTVEKAREYLNAKGLQEIAFLNYKTKDQPINDGLDFYKFTKYTIKSVTII